MTNKMLRIAMVLGVLATAGGSSFAQADGGNGQKSAGEGTGEQVVESLEGAGELGEVAAASAGVDVCMPELLCGAVIGGNVLCQVFPDPGEEVDILWEDANGPYATEGTIQVFSCAGVDEVFVEVTLYYPGDRELILRQTTECL